MRDRTAAAIRAEREKIGDQVEKLRAKMKELSNELRAVEGPIPDRAHRGRETGYSITKAAAE